MNSCSVVVFFSVGGLNLENLFYTYLCVRSIVGYGRIEVYRDYTHWINHVWLNAINPFIFTAASKKLTIVFNLIFL